MSDSGSVVVRPPPYATLAPLRERLWNEASQSRILKDELLGLALYRRLAEREKDAALLARLEEFFDALIAHVPQLDSERVYCVRFPSKLPAAARFLVSRCAERYHLQTASFGEGQERFVVVYLHPRDAMRPVLRCSDFAHAKTYYKPPPPPAYDYKRQKNNRSDRTREEYHLEATELPLPSDFDFSPWMSSSHGEGEASASGYECEVAACHEHLIEVSGFATDRPAPSLQEAASLVPKAVAIRPLPTGFVAVFSNVEDAKSFLSDHTIPADAPSSISRPTLGSVPLFLRDAADNVDAWACYGRPLAVLHQRRALQLNERGQGSAPRALQAALRGLGAGERVGSHRCQRDPQEGSRRGGDAAKLPPQRNQ